MGVIYVRPNLINGKKYVGQATNLKKRQNRWNDLNQPYAGPAINAARAKYGLEAFGFEILKECDDKELDYWEKYYVKELNTKAPYGYNLTDGGGGMSGYTLSEETRKKLSEINKGKCLSEETKRKIGEGHKGLVRSQETRKKLSEANKGKHLTQETRKKMSEANKGKHLTEETKNKMSEAKKGEKHWNYGKHLSIETKNKISENFINRKDQSKPVLQIDKKTNEVIKEFPSVREVERQLGFIHNNISKCCNGKRQTAYGFIWKYKEESAA